jgi:hypothetical protein
MNLINRYLWLSLLIVIFSVLFLLFLEIRINIKERQMTDQVSVASRDQEIYLSIANPIDKLFHYNSCGGYQVINIGRFILTKDLEDQEPKFNSYVCNGKKKEILQGIKEKYYYSCSGIVISRTSHIFCN